MLSLQFEIIKEQQCSLNVIKKVRIKDFYVQIRTSDLVVKVNAFA